MNRIVHSVALGASLMIGAVQPAMAGTDDLGITSVHVRPDRISVSAQITASVTTRSTLASQKTTDLGIYLCPSATWTPRCTLLKGKVIRVPAGKGVTRTFTERARIPGALVERFRGDTAYLTARIDYRNKVRESDENNNTKSTRVTLVRPSTRAMASGLSGSISGTQLGARNAARIREEDTRAGISPRLSPDFIQQAIDQERELQRSLSESRGGRALRQLRLALKAYKDAYAEMRRKSMQCMNRSYSRSESRAAGCTASMSVYQCDRRRYNWCMRSVVEKLRRARGPLNRAKDRMDQLLSRLKDCKGPADITHLQICGWAAGVVYSNLSER